MKTRSEALNKILAADPDIDHTIAFIGNGTQNTGTVFIALKPRKQRKATAEEIMARLRPKLAQVPGIMLYLQSVQDVRAGGRFSRTQSQYTLQDADIDELMTWAPRMFQRLKTVPVVRDVATDQQTAGLELDVIVDRDSAARLGVSMKTIDDTLYDAFGQRRVATLYGARNQSHVVLEAKPEHAQGPEALGALWLRSAAGGVVPLLSVAKVQTSTVPLSVNHQGQFPSVTLSFNTPPGVALSQAVEAINKMEQDMGLPAGVHGTFTGNAGVFKDLVSSEIVLLVAALIAVYIVLGM